MSSNVKNAKPSTTNENQGSEMPDAKNAAEAQSKQRVRYENSPKMRIVDEIKLIRKKKRLAKFSLEHRAEELNRNTYSRRHTRRILTLLPSLAISYEFKKIVKWFIEPLFRKDSLAELSLEQKSDLFFSTATRDIVPAVAVTKITKMPGLVIDEENGRTRLPTISEANIPLGTPLFVRIDDAMPNRIDIENCEKPGLVFILTSNQYKSIIDSIREIEGCNYRLDPPGEIRNADGTYTQLTSKRNVR